MIIKNTQFQASQPKFRIQLEQLRSNSFNMKEKMPKHPILEALEKTQEENKGRTLSQILDKLYSGKKLTQEELKFLRENAPEMYEKALKVMKAREELERQMAQAKTKEQVETIKMSMNASLIAGAKSNPDTAEVNSIIMEHYKDAYNEYTKTEEYKKKKGGNYDTFEDG